eukprot:bmy_20512T0
MPTAATPWSSASPAARHSTHENRVHKPGAATEGGAEQGTKASENKGKWLASTSGRGQRLLSFRGESGDILKPPPKKGGSRDNLKQPELPALLQRSSTARTRKVSQINWRKLKPSEDATGGLSQPSQGLAPTATCPTPGARVRLALGPATQNDSPAPRHARFSGSPQLGEPNSDPPPWCEWLLVRDAGTLPAREGTLPRAAAASPHPVHPRGTRRSPGTLPQPRVFPETHSCHPQADPRSVGNSRAPAPRAAPYRRCPRSAGSGGPAAATVQAELHENHRKTTYKKEEIRITWLAIWID